MKTRATMNSQISVPLRFRTLFTFQLNIRVILPLAQGKAARAERLSSSGHALTSSAGTARVQASTERGYIMPSMNDRKPTLDYARPPNRSDERRKVWWAIELCLAVLFIAVGLLLLVTMVIAALAQ